MTRPSLPGDLEVFIEAYDPQGKASYISGYFQFMKAHMNFNCIMMDEYGGPNVAVVLPDETQKMLRELGVDNDAMDTLITVIQRKIMEGGVHMQIPEDNREPK